MIADFNGRGSSLLVSVHSYDAISCLPMVQARVQYIWDEQKAAARLQRLPAGLQRVSELQLPQSRRRRLLCGYSKTAPPGCRVRAPETTGALPSNVTNTMWHVAACSRTSPPTPLHSYCCTVFPFFSLSFSDTQTPTQTGTDINTKKTPKNSSIKKTKKQWFSISLPQIQTLTHKDIQTEGTELLTLAWTHTHTQTHTRASLYSPRGCHQKQPLWPTLCKSNSLLLFSLAPVFSIPPACSSSPLCCPTVTPRHPTSPTPLQPPNS